MTDEVVSHARRCAEHFRCLGLCPLPSRSDDKAPDMRSYSEHYEGVPVPEEVYTNWRARNVQILTGTKTPTATKLLVVDCDGEEAMEKWSQILRHYDSDACGAWVSLTGSGCGMHTYYRLPVCVRECPSGIIWGQWDTWGDNGKGKWTKHREIRIMADRALVVAPPSLHVDTGEPYRFVPINSPKSNRLPKFAPDWLLSMRRLPNPIFELPAARNPEPKRWTRSTNGHHSTADVLNAIDDKLSLARSWGVVFKGGANQSGWVCCFVPGRESPERSCPSGSFNVDSGYLQDRKDNSLLSLFDVGVATGRYYTWQDCCNSLGDQFCRR